MQDTKWEERKEAKVTVAFLWKGGMVESEKKKKKRGTLIHKNNVKRDEISFAEIVWIFTATFTVLYGDRYNF